MSQNFDGKSLTTKPTPKQNQLLKKLKLIINAPQTLISVVAILFLILFSFIAFNLVNQGGDTAQAGINCPANYTWNGSGCQSTETTARVCPSGGTLQTDGNCLSTGYTCPNGGTASGTTCVASTTTPIQTQDGCFLGGTYFPSYPGHPNIRPLCAVNVGQSTSNQPFSSVVSYNIVGSCDPGDLGQGLTYRPAYAPNVIGVIKIAQLSEPACGIGMITETEFSSGAIRYGYILHYVPGLRFANTSYAATATNTVTDTSTCPAGHAIASATTCRSTTTAAATGYTIDNALVGTGTCTPTSVAIGTPVTTCTFPLTGSPNGQYNIPDSGLFAGVRNTATDAASFLGNSNACTVAGAVLTCTNLPTTNGTAGSKTIVIHQPNVAWYPSKGTVTLVATRQLTHNDIVGGINGQTFAAATNLQCSDAVAYSTTTCTGTLPAGITPPATGLKLNVEGQTGITCTFTAQNFTCANMPAGSTTGTRKIQAAVGTNAPADTGKTINVTPKTITAPDLPNIGTGNVTDPFENLTCGTNNSVVAGTTTTCTGTLKSGYQIPTDFQLGVGTNPSGSCTQTGQTVTCTNVPVTTTLDTQPLKAKTGTTTADTGKTITVTAPVDTNTCTQTRPCILFENEIVFNPTKANPPKFGQQDLRLSVVSTVITSQIESCTISTRVYGSSSYTNIKETTASTGSLCSGLLTKQAQVDPKWDFEVKIKTTDGKYYQANPSYFLKYGAIGLVTISAVPV